MDNGKTVTMSIGDDKSAIASPDSWPLSLAGHFHWQIEVQASSHPWKIGEKKQIDSKKLTPSCQAVKDGTTYLYTVFPFE